MGNMSRYIFYVAYVIVYYKRLRKNVKLLTDMQKEILYNMKSYKLKEVVYV